VGTNLVNDYVDFKKGADTPDRLGPVRVTQSGLIAPPTVLGAAFVFFGLATLAGVYLVNVAGWPVVAMGVASLLAGYGYTGGPFPLAYHGLGDVFVFVFFGLVAVNGTYFVQAHQLSTASWLGGITVGALGTTLIVVNNLRDIPTDVLVGKRTLAVRLGVTGSRVEYTLLLCVALATPLAMVALGTAPSTVMACALAIPLMVPPLRQVWTGEGKALNPALGGSARVQLVFGVLFCLGLLV
jgi:1,4-dihydroxy-2-naphthoate octaprenyltransferase